MTQFRMIKWNSNINAIIFLILGLLLLIYPIESLNIGGYLIASILMLSGLSYIIRIIQNKGIETNGDIIYLIVSVLFIALSISIFVDPTWIIRMINVLVGIILIVNSIMNLINLFKYKKDRTTTWWIYTVLTSIIFVLGVVVIINPLFLVNIITRLEGATLIINSLMTLLLTRRISKLLKIENNTVKDLQTK